MYVVALCELSGTPESEAGELASLLGMATYDLRVALSGVLPRVVRQTPERGEADDLLRTLRARGHGALIADLAHVVPGTAMIKVHRFSADDAALWANDHEGDSLAWEHIGAIIALDRRVEVIRTLRERDLLSQVPMRPTPRASALHRTSEHVLDHALYLFSRERGARPWIILEQEAQYLSLGPRMRLTRHDNFKALIALLRARAPGAIYDERFVAQPRTASQLVQVRGRESPVPEVADVSTDLMVHLLAEWLMRARGGPYREASRVV